ncbi:MAG: glutathione S-transferase family protein [Thalassotalea sp.]|nr:glutathione S-transferase family protein [Thalassotalea sp.]MDG2394242.1 glutathione S-transferase family protein [Thalassotalea sp.]
MTIKLWHCHNSRSLRVLWALEEMQLDYKVHSMPFPPRFLEKSFIELNHLGTVPYLEDGETKLTESSAMLLYLAQHYQQDDLSVPVTNPEYGNFLNWLFQSDATLTFPQTLVLRYSQFEAQDRQNSQVSNDYALWFLARLKRLNTHLTEHDYLSANKFTIADIAVGYALYLGELLGLSLHYKPQTLAYLNRLKARPSFIKTVDIGKDIANYEIKPFALET